MKKIVVTISLASTILFSSCLGQFAAFNNLKEWNESLTDDDFANNAVFWALNIIPVYGLFIFGDIVVLNVIEFWTGANPLAMKDGERKVKYVNHDGQKLKLVATKNEMNILVVKGNNEGKNLTLTYNVEDKSWNTIDENGEAIKLTSFKDGFNYVYLPNGETIKIDAKTNVNEGLALIQKALNGSATGVYTYQP